MRRIPWLVALAASAIAGAALASPPAPIPLAKAPAKLQSLVRALRQAADEKDAAAVYRALAPSYYLERDFGGSFDPKASPIENFSATFQFDETKLRPEYKDYGWQAFRKILESSAFDRKPDGQLCLPHGAMEAKPLPRSQLCFRETEHGDWWIAGHVNGGD